MRVAGIEKFGDGVTVLEVPDPRAPRTGEVLIEVKAAGVGNWDEFAGLDVGILDADRTALGVAAAGAVAAVGAGFGGWSVGIRRSPIRSHSRRRMLGAVARGRGRPARPQTGGASVDARRRVPVPALTAVQVLDKACA